MKPTRALSLSASLAALITPSASALNFVVDTASCDGDPFANLAIDVTCNGSENCQFGDTADIAGTVEATAAFSNSDVVLKACVFDLYCPDANTRNTGALCDNWLEPLDGQDCGAVGAYKITGQEEIPTADIPNAWSWMVTVRIGVEDECAAEAGASSYQSTMSYSMLGVMTLAMVGAACAAKRRRGAGEEDEDEEGSAARFVEMRDHAVV